VPGTLNVTLDWTFAADSFTLIWGQGDCHVNPNCPIVTGPFVGLTKPASLATGTLQAGTYTFVYANNGANTEAVSYTIFFTH
jgi:hypothetical protein